jgi:serine/threonine protein kinase/Leucine-rich repeat (LRR) protein
MKVVHCPRCRKPLIAKAQRYTFPQKSQDSGDAGYAESSPRREVSIKRHTVKGVRRTDESRLNLRRCLTGEYELKDLIGKGGLGMVYLARQGAVDRDVAVKMLNSDVDDAAECEAFLIAEATVTGDLEHPNIVPVYDTGETADGIPFYAMKYLAGKRWSQVIRKITLADNIDILMSVMNAVAFAHSKGVIHRDLKPANVMLGDFGEVVVMDWGEAVAVEPTAKANRITESTACNGTPAYMAPEMARGDIQVIGTRSDVYLLGAILYEAVAGHRPRVCDSDVDECLNQACENIIEPTDKEGELLDIAMTAMATEPDDRYQSVKELQEAIRDYQKHAESFSMTHRANNALEQALDTQEYATFSRSIVNYEDALELWQDNTGAQEGLAAAREAYAECALAKGDFDLSWSLIEAAGLRESDLAERVRAARRGRWEAIYHQDFTKKDADLSGLAFCGTRMLTKEVSAPLVKNGAMQLQRLMAFWISDLKIREGVTVEMQVRWPNQVDGLEILINSRREQPEENASFMPPGYGSQFGGGMGTLNCISRNDKAQAPNQADSVTATFKPGCVYRLGFDRHADEVSLSIDGKLLHRRTELLPMVGADLENIGVRNWGEDVEILSFTVWRRAMPEKASPLVAGDALFRRGHIREAVDEYLAVAADFKGKPIAEHALVKAYLAAFRLTEDAGRARHTIKTEMIKNHRGSALLSTLWEADCVAAWQDKQWRKALDTLPEIFKFVPETRVVLQMLACPHEPLPEDVGRDLLTWAAKTTGINRLAINNFGLTNLSPLAGLALTSLNCGWNRISSLEPLRGMPLTFLDCGTNMVGDLEPLRGMPLSHLQCTCNQIASLEPLTGMPLTTLACSDNRIASLDPIAGMQLVKFYADGNQLDSLAALSGMPLTSVACCCNRIKTLEPLRGIKLVDLRFNSNDISSLAPLSGMPLANLYCECNRISSLNPLLGSDLVELVCPANHIADLDPLKRMKSLRTLDFSDNFVVSLEPLRGLRLEEVNFNDNQVDSLEPLGGMPLSRLWCAGNPIRTLEPFITELPPDFLFDSASLDEGYEERILAKWGEVADLRDLVRQNLIMRGLRKGAKDLLLAMATQFQQHHYLVVRKELTWIDAMAAAKIVDGHLLTLTSREEHEFALSICSGNNTNWLGLQPGDSGDVWVTGEPLVYEDYAIPSYRQRPFPKHISRQGLHWRCQTVENLRGAFIIEWDE